MILVGISIDYLVLLLRLVEVLDLSLVFDDVSQLQRVRRWVVHLVLDIFEYLLTQPKYVKYFPKQFLLSPDPVIAHVERDEALGLRGVLRYLDYLLISEVHSRDI